jgi:Flp pilus assembly protein TadG
MKKRNRFDLLRGEHGASLVELALLLPLFPLLLLGAVDFGRAFYLQMELAGAVHAAAMYGSQNPSDTAGMKTVAQDDAPNVPGLTVNTPTYGRECSDGTSYSAGPGTMPACTGLTGVYRVNVTVTATYTPLFPWSWAGMGRIPSSFTFSSSASARNR